MDFENILNSPLPSKQTDGLFGESGDDIDFEDLFSEKEMFEMGLLTESSEEYDFDIDAFGESDDYGEDDDDVEEGCGGSGCAKEEGDNFLYGDDDTIADELDSIMADDPDYPDDTGLDDEIEDDFGDEDIEDEPGEDIPEPLDGPADRKADNLLAMSATPMLLRDELTAQESAAFYESDEGEIAISEGLILESDLTDLFQEGVFANPNKPFKLTKKARMNQLYELSVQIEARLHGDPIYAKLQKAYAVERMCKKFLRQKYHLLALRRSKIYLKRLMNSKSGVLSKIGKKIGLKK